MKLKASYSVALAVWGFLAGIIVVVAVNWILDVPIFSNGNSAAQPVAQNGYYEASNMGRGSLPIRQTAADIGEDRSNAIINSVQQVSPAVVSISLIVERHMLSRGYRYYMDPFYDRRQGNTVRQKIPKIGTGFIINPDGMIITNHHVIENGTDIMVSLQDGREFPAEILGQDKALDLALLKIDGQNLPFAPLGNSDELVTGEWAIAIGNPFGSFLQDNQPSVTVGVISAVSRKFVSGEDDDRYYQDMIQTDAAINPGNSGGPLVNAHGEVIGVNTFIFTSGGGNIGLGFARPVNEVKRLIDEILTYGKIREVYLGFYAQTISRVLQRTYNLPSDDGFIIVSVDKGSPAWEAGLRRGDVVYALDDLPVKGAGDANAKIGSLKVGDQLKLKVYRNGRYMDMAFMVKER